MDDRNNLRPYVNKIIKHTIEERQNGIIYNTIINNFTFGKIKDLIRLENDKILLFETNDSLLYPFFNDALIKLLDDYYQCDYFSYVIEDIDKSKKIYLCIYLDNS